MFEIVGDITNVQVIATGRGIRRLKTLRKRHGGKRWRKLKGDATVRLTNGSLRRAEIHWYEAHGLGKRGLKIKSPMDVDSHVEFADEERAVEFEKYLKSGSGRAFSMRHFR